MAALTGLRGVAALTVYVAHSRFDDLVPALKPVCAWFEWHAFAVDLFFMLSGFVLMQVYAGRLASSSSAGWRSYARARLARVFPLHLATLAAAMGIYGCGSLLLGKWPVYLTWQALLTNVFLVQNWPGTFQLSINLPSWSLSVELFCYLVWLPVLVLLAGRLRSAWNVVPWLAVLLVVRGSLVGEAIAGWESLVRGSTSFLAGGLLQRLHTDRPARVLAFATVAAALAFLGLRTWTAATGHASAAVLATFPVLILGLAQPLGTWVHRALASRPMLHLGDLSYSLYLWQAPVALITCYQVRPRLQGLPVAVGALWLGVEVLLMLALAALSYRKLELPLRDWIRRWGSDRSRMPATPKPADACPAARCDPS